MRLRCLFVLLTLISGVLCATHNRAGEIIVRTQDCTTPEGQLTACVTIITYTETAQTEVDRDSLELNWGDGTLEMIPRDGRIFPIAPGIQRNEYKLCHRYGSAGRYVLSFQDVNRVRGVRNIPSSVNIPFSVFTSFTLLNPIRNGCNSSPELTQDPIDNACIGSVWTHNPGAFDVDGDSLAFEFTTPSFAPRAPIANYVLPNMVSGATGSLEIDPQTGQITWDTPSAVGEYNIAFLVKSFRNGIPLDTLVRDMQVFVDDCANDPPIIETARDQICVVAGELVEFQVIATAPLTDTDERVTLTATGRPFQLANNPATFLPEVTDPQDDPVVRTFRWQTTCNDISKQEYFIVLRALDTGPPRPSGLATLRTISIKVVAPPPEDVQTEVEDELITVSWEKPYFCEDNIEPSLDGFSVYRREGSNNFVPDTCETGLAGRGYTLLNDAPVTTMSDGRYVFQDDDVVRGRTYCYRVVAELVRRNPATGLIFDDLESIPSEEVCVQLDRDIPLLTKVDVAETGTTDGQIDVCWVRPEASSLDTLNNPGPYRYVLSRATGLTSDPIDFVDIATFTAEFFGDPIDTCYTDLNLDTETTGYAYRIELFVDERPAPQGDGQSATSVRLGGSPTDRTALLDWIELVPWTNTSYDVFRQSPGSTDFEIVGTVTNQQFTDTGLENGLEYCYFVRSEGSYNIENIPSPLLNRSQIVCVTPEDDVPPCPPVLSVESVCDREVDCTDTDNLFNELTWTAPFDECGVDDVAGYRVFFSADSVSAPQVVGEVQDPNLLTFRHFPGEGIVGCYTVTAFDVNGNESGVSNEVCVTNCPIYELPNVFTPNGDSRNDILQPRANCFVERVAIQIRNRWGQLVYETADPLVNWDGNNLSGDPLPSGTYYYSGQVFERRLTGIAPAEGEISGYIELIRGR